MLRETLGQYIKRLRIEAGFTQTDLADRIGISRNAISDYERDNYSPTIRAIVYISDYLPIDFEYVRKLILGE